MPIRELPHGLKILLQHDIFLSAIQGHPEGDRYVDSLPGIIHSMSSAIKELKEGLLRPEDLGESVSRRDLQISSLLRLVYERYQDRLEAEGFCDREDLLLEAAAHLEAARLRGSPGDTPRSGFARYLAVLGFYDLNPLQMKFFRSLVGASGEVEIVLPVTNEMVGNGLPSRFLDSLLEMGAGVSGWDGTTAEWDRDRDPVIDIVEVPDPLRESEHVARLVKKEVLGGSDLEGCDVVVRPFSEYERLLRVSFERFGVPVDGLDKQLLSSNPAVRVLVSCLEAVSGGFERDSVVKLLTSSYLAEGIWGGRERSPGPVLLDLVDLARIVSGSGEWLAGFEKLKEEITDGTLWDPGDGVYRRDPLRSGIRESRGRPGELLRVCDGVSGFLGILQDVPSTATPAEFTDAIFHLAERLKIVDGILSHRDLRVAARDLGAFEALDECLGSRDRVLVGEARIGLEDFVTLINSILRAVSCGGHVISEGGVPVIDPLEKRHHTSSVTVVCGMTEGYFGGFVSGREVLGEEVRREINERAGGEALPTAARRKEEEDLIFQVILRRTRGRLVLTYPSLDEGSREVIRSRFIDGLVSERRAGHTRMSPVGIVFRPEDICDKKDMIWNLVPFAKDLAVFTVPEGLEDIRPIVDGIHRRVEIERARDRGRAKGWDGRLVAEGILRDIGERFGGDFVYTPSILGNYIACPFLFLVTNVWGLEGREATRLGMSRTQRGKIIHRVLNLFFRSFLDEGDFSWESVGDRVQRLEDIAGQVLEEFFRTDYVGPRGLFDIERGAVIGELTEFVRKDIELSEELDAVPALLEYSLQDGEGEVRVKTPSGEVRIGGRLDRVDSLRRPGNGHVVIDYKTGFSPSLRETAEGRSVQIPLYIIGLEKKGYDVVLGFYYHVGEGKRKAIVGPGADLIGGKGSPESPGWDSIRETILRKLGEVVESIRNGDFRSTADECPSYCDLRDLCRVDPSRRRRSWRGK